MILNIHISEGLENSFSPFLTCYKEMHEAANDFFFGEHLGKCYNKTLRVEKEKMTRKECKI